MASLKKNFGYNLIYQVFLMITPFITAPYVSRVLGADGVGIYSYTSSIMSYFTIFGALGTASYGMREISQHRDREEERSKLFWEIEFLTIFTSTVAMLVWIGVIVFSKEYRWYYLALTPLLLGTMFDISWFFNGMEVVRNMVLRNSIVKIIGILCLFIFVRTKSDLLIYILIQSVSTCLANAAMWIDVPKYVNKVPLRTLTFKKHFRETWIYFVPTIATSIYTVLDKTLIGLITKNSYENGYYEQATKIVNMIKAVVFSAVNTVIGARNSYLFGQSRVKEAREITLRSMNFILFLGLGCVFGIWGVADKFVPAFFGDGYEPVIGMLRMLSPIVIIIGISNCLGSQYYNPAGKRSQSATYIIAGSGVNLVLNLCLIPKFGAYGAIVASIIAEMTITVLYMKNCERFLVVKDIFILSWKKIIAGFVMLFVLLMIQKMFDASGLIYTGCLVFAGAVVYAIVIVILRDESIQEVKRIITKRK